MTGSGAGEPRRLTFFPTCIVDAVTPEVGVAAVRLLRRCGYEVALAESATCCGQPAWNAGQVDAAARVARGTAAALAAGSDTVVVPAGSCATMIRVFWAELFALAGDDQAAADARIAAGRVRELSEFLAGTELPPVTAPSPRVVSHRSCHMLRELGIAEQPESLLDAVAVGHERSTAEGRCCGFGGLFSVKLPETSTAMADDVLDAAAATGVGEMVGCDSSCLMHLAGRADRRGMALRFRHLAEVLEEVTR